MTVKNLIKEGTMMLNPDVGKKVKVFIPFKKRFERVLHEDSTGLYVKYDGGKMKVVPELNFQYEPTGDYIRFVKKKSRRKLK